MTEDKEELLCSIMHSTFTLHNEYEGKPAKLINIRIRELQKELSTKHTIEEALLVVLDIHTLAFIKDKNEQIKYTTCN